MKKLTKFLFLFLISFLFISLVNAKNNITVYFFYGDGCPHCAAEENAIISKLEDEDNIEVKKYEVWYNEDNQALLKKVQESYGVSTGVPCTVIGNTAIVGYNSNTKEKINDVLEYYQNNDYEDQMIKIINNEKVEFTDSYEKSLTEVNQEINTIFGNINLSKVSVGVAAIIIGLVDGFNPCAMWVLLFLISTLIGMNDKKKMIIYGSVFLLTSGLVYFIIMFSWLNIIINVSTSIYFRNIIAIIAIIAGLYNLYNYYKSLKKDDGCNVVNKEKRKSIISRIKKFTQEKSFILAILGVMALAISVNIVELLCSAGLPLIFSEILAINNISGAKAIIYDLIYIIFFMIDDFIVFLIAVKTMNIVGISTKFNKYSHLIGGLIMLLIGLLLIFKPEWVMLNF